MSAAKVFAAFYVMVGVLVGALMFVISLFAKANPDAAEAVPMGGAIMGGLALVGMPIFYGVFGLIFTYLSAVGVNFVMGILGGIKLSVDVE